MDYILSEDRINILKKNKFQSLSNLVTFFQEDNCTFLIFQYIEGLTLKEYLSRKKIDLSTKERIGKELVYAYTKLQRAEFVHGDISINNIIINEKLECTFIDPILSINGNFRNLGTFNFLAPELLTPGSVSNTLSDWFSLCVTLYYLFEEKYPFPCESLEEYSIKFATNNLIIHPFKNTPSSFNELIKSGLEVNSSKRQFKRIKKLFSLRFLLLPIVVFVSIAFYINPKKNYHFDSDLQSNVIDIKNEDLTVIRDVGKAPFYIRQHPKLNEILVCNAHSPYITIIEFVNGKARIKDKIQLKTHFSHDVAFIDDDLFLVSSSVTNSILVVSYKERKVLKGVLSVSPCELT